MLEVLWESRVTVKSFKFHQSPHRTTDFPFDIYRYIKRALGECETYWARSLYLALLSIPPSNHSPVELCFLAPAAALVGLLVVPAAPLVLPVPNADLTALALASPYLSQHLLLHRTRWMASLWNLSQFKSQIGVYRISILLKAMLIARSKPLFIPIYIKEPLGSTPCHTRHPDTHSPAFCAKSLNRPFYTLYP